MPIYVVMGSDSTDGRLQAELHETVERVQRRIRGELQNTSSLPVAMFNACDPMIEAVLAHAASTVFLEHMLTSADLHVMEITGPAVEDVRPHEMQALGRQLAAEDEQGPPSLMGGLTRERLWVLLDLVVKGSAQARIGAATRLHETITEILDPGQLDPMLLGQVASLLQEACLRDDMPSLLRDLLDQAAGQHLEQDQAPGEEKP